MLRFHVNIVYLVPLFSICLPGIAGVRSIVFSEDGDLWIVYLWHVSLLVALLGDKTAAKHTVV